MREGWDFSEFLPAPRSARAVSPWPGRPAYVGYVCVYIVCIFRRYYCINNRIYSSVALARSPSVHRVCIRIYSIYIFRILCYLGRGQAVYLYICIFVYCIYIWLAEFLCYLGSGQAMYLYICISVYLGIVHIWLAEFLCFSGSRQAQARPRGSGLQAPGFAF